MRIEDTYTIQEVFEMNSSQFPFWVKGWTNRHKVMKVNYKYKGKEVFVGQTYSIDLKTLLNNNVQLIIDNEKGWLPVAI